MNHGSRKVFIRGSLLPSLEDRMTFHEPGVFAVCQRRTTRVRVPAAVLAGFAVLLVLVALTPSTRASDIDVTIQTQLVHGVRATFGFNLQYTPSEMLARPGTEVTLGFAPGPTPATLTVDVLGLLGSAGVSIPSLVTDIVNSTAASLGISNLWVATIPIADTPIGSYQVYSLPLYEGIPVYLDINLVGLLNGDLSASAGSLERTQLTWTKWGGQDVNLTLPSRAADVTVSASFKYSVNNDYVISFDVPGFYESYPIASFSLGEISFGKTTTSHIEVIEEASTTGAGGIAPVSLGLGLGIGAAAGAVAGLVIGKRLKK
jgi:hypothetical protein